MSIQSMNIAFLCGLFPNSIQEEIYAKSKGSVEHAANALQWAIFDGLTQLNVPTKVFTLPYILSYPLGYNSSKIKDDTCNLNNITEINTVGFFNLIGYRFFSRYRHAKKALINWAKKTKGKKVILIYAIHFPFLKAAIEVKENFPEIKICLIVPDLPQFMSENSNPLYRLSKKIESYFINNLLKKIDSFVLLTENMVEPLNIRNKPWTIVEGIYNNKEIIDIQEKEVKKTILYTGNIDKRYGIITLIDAFSQIKSPNYQLWIRGDGNTKDEILEHIKIDNRITYFNRLSRADLLKLQKRATVLVNPVPSNEIFTKYIFPSKTMEYLASGTPTIMYRLGGIPEEYFQYCFTPDEENTVGLKKIIIKVCEMDQKELFNIGKKASIFINDHKNPIKQVSTICNMLNKLEFK